MPLTTLLLNVIKTIIRYWMCWCYSKMLMRSYLSTTQRRQTLCHLSG